MQGHARCTHVQVASATLGYITRAVAQLGSIMVGNRYWMPPPRQFQPMFQMSSRQSMKLLCYNPQAKIQLDMNIIGLSHNPTMAVTRGIPPAGNQCSRVQQTRRSRGHKSFICGDIRGEAALMSPARRRSRPLVCTHIPCVALTSLLDRVLLPLRLRKKSCVMPVGTIVYTPGIEPTLSGTRHPCTSSILRYRCG